MSIKSNPHDERWSKVVYVVYDAPHVPGPFSTRLVALRSALAATTPSNIAKPLKQTVCKGNAHVLQELERIHRMGGEGVMLKKPDGGYQSGRSGKALLKV